MSKRILLIDSDESFAQGLSSAMTARGFVATTATNSEQGITLAKSEMPDLIVVCVEAQPTNGYMLCTRLKKDAQLKNVPVILTSANATPDSFEKHKKLKTRAEEYLIKPFEPKVILEKAAALLHVPVADDGEEIAVDDEPLGLGDLVEGDDEPISLSEQDVAQAHSASTEEPLVVEEVEEVVSIEEPQGDEGPDDDLKMFDAAFDNLPASGGPSTDEEKAFTTLRLAPEPEPVSDEPVIAEDVPSEPTELSAPDDDAVLHGLIGDNGGAPADEMYDAGRSTSLVTGDDARVSELEARVNELEQKLAEREAELEQARKGTASSGELLKAREAKTRADKEVLRLKEELNAKDKELVDLQEANASLDAEAQQLRDEAVKREATAKTLQQRADALAAAAKKFERELSQAREDLKHAGAGKSKVAELEKLSAAHDDLKKKHDQVSTELAGVREMHAEQTDAARAAQDEALKAKAELETLRTEVAALTGEKDLLAEEREQLRKQLDDAVAAAQQNEERAVKAYQQLKEGEKLREKARQALDIAQRLLDENGSADDLESALEKAS